MQNTFEKKATANLKIYVRVPTQQIHDPPNLRQPPHAAPAAPAASQRERKSERAGPKPIIISQYIGPDLTCHGIHRSANQTNTNSLCKQYNRYYGWCIILVYKMYTICDYNT